MIVKLLTEHHLEFLSLKGCCTGSSESTLVKMSNCWKSHVTAQFELLQYRCDLWVLPCVQIFSHALKPFNTLSGIIKVSHTKINIERLKSRNIFVFQHFSFYEPLKFHAQMS